MMKPVENRSVLTCKSMFLHNQSRKRVGNLSCLGWGGKLGDGLVVKRRVPGSTAHSQFPKLTKNISTTAHTFFFIFCCFFLS